MRVLSRILITVFVLLGIAFVVMLNFSSCQHEGNYAGCGSYESKFGVNANGSESPTSVPKKPEIVAWLEARHVGKQCYKIRFWKDGHVNDQVGSLAAIQSITKEGVQFPGPKNTAPSGSSGTQRVMFNSTETRDAFKKYIGK